MIYLSDGLLNSVKMECVINEPAFWNVYSNHHNIQELYMFTEPVFFLSDGSVNAISSYSLGYGKSYAIL